MRFSAPRPWSRARFTTPAENRRRGGAKGGFRPRLDGLEERMLLASILWDGGPAGTGTQWNVAVNWQGDLLPTQADDAVIPQDFNGITISSTADTSVRSVTSAAALSITGGLFSIAADSTINNTLTVGAEANLTLANLTLNSTGTVTSAGTLTLNGTRVNAALVNQGNAFVHGTVTLNGAFSNPAGASLMVEGSPVFSDARLIGPSAGFHNAGTIQLTSTGGALDATVSVAAGDLTNDDSGLIQVDPGAGGARTIEAELTNRGTIAVNSDLGVGVVGAGGNHVNSGSITLNNAVANVQGDTFTNTASGRIASSGSSALDSSATDTVRFSNLGTLTVSPGTFTVSAGFDNFSNSTRLTGGVYVISGTFRFANASIAVDAANIILNGPAAAITDLNGADALASLATITADGRLTLDRGRSLQRANPFTNAGVLAIGSDSTFTASSDYAQTGRAGLSSNGTLILNGGGLATDAFILSDPDSLLLFRGGTFHLTTGAAIRGQGVARIDGATISGEAPVSVSNLELVQGTWTGDSPLVVTGNLLWTGGTMSGAGQTLLPGGAFGQIDGAAVKTLDGRTLTISGRLLWVGGGSLNLANNALLDVTARGILDINNSSSIMGSGLVRSNGSIRKDHSEAGATTVAAGVAVRLEDGLLLVNTGTLDLVGGYTEIGGRTFLNTGTTLASAGGVFIQGGRLSGDGTVKGNVTNNGVIDPGNTATATVGTLTIAGNYVQTAGGSITIQIGGSNPGTGFSRLVILGAARLQGGTMNVVRLNNFVPKVGEAFPVLKAPKGVVGKFAAFTGLHFSPTRVLVPKPSRNGLSLLTSGVPGTRRLIPVAARDRPLARVV